MVFYVVFTSNNYNSLLLKICYEVQISSNIVIKEAELNTFNWHSNYANASLLFNIASQTLGCSNKQVYESDIFKNKLLLLGKTRALER